jgi:hypothetical protein
MLRKLAPDDVAEALSTLLVFTAQQFNCVRNLTDLQIMLLANDLPARYWHWRIDEFAYVLKEAVAGRWGKIYDRLDPPTVQEWCAAYDAERQEAVSAESESTAAKLKASEKNTAPPLDMSKAYLRARLEALSDEDLDAGMTHYKQNPHLPDARLKLELAAEVLAARWAYPVATPTARSAAQRAEDHAMELALARGDRAAAGLPDQPMPGLYDGLPTPPEFTY